MGVQSTFRFPAESVPQWEPLKAKVAETGDTPVLRMIDGMPAFPDENPEEGWAELRIALAGTMLTLRRTGDAITVVTWGTADPALESARNRVCQAYLALAGTPVGP